MADVTITDEMVEAAARAMHDGPLGANDEEDFGVGSSSNWCREMALVGLTAALAQAPTGVVIKELEWEYTPEGEDIFESWRASSVFGSYHVIKYESQISWIGPFAKARDLPSIDEAKAAAQADYEARILAALSSPARGQREGGDAIVKFDDGSEVALASFSGGNAKGGMFAELSLMKTLADGTTLFRRYKATSEWFNPDDLTFFPSHKEGDNG